MIVDGSLIDVLNIIIFGIPSLFVFVILIILILGLTEGFKYIFEILFFKDITK